MLLAIDSGNTNIVFSVFNGDDITHTWRCRNDVSRTSDEYATWLSDVFRQNGISWADIKHCIMASVVPDVESTLAEMCQSYANITPHVVGKTIQSPLGANVDNPAEVGADRLVNGIAVHHQYSTPCIVVDFGTATTFDVFGDGGCFLGGVIAPGVNLSLESLHNATAKLPAITIANPGAVVGKNTIHGMQSGLYWGYVSLCEGIIARIKTEMNWNDCTIIATGGLSSLFQQSLPMMNHCDPDLTVRGLKILHDTTLKEH